MSKNSKKHKSLNSALVSKNEEAKINKIKPLNIFTRIGPYLAILAFGLSIFNIIDTRHKWDVLNNANVVITDLKTTITGEVNMDSLKKIDFGIKYPLYGPSDVSNKINIYHFLIPYDRDKRINLPIKPITRTTLIEALNVLGPFKNIIIYKAINFNIYYKNIGKTVAKNCNVSVYMIPDISQKLIGTEINDEPQNLYPSDLITMISGEFQFPGNSEIPETIKFGVIISYMSINSEKVSREEKYTWHRSTAKFSPSNN